MITKNASNEILPWLILHLAPQFGPQSLKKCLQHFASPQEICTLSFAQLQPLNLHPRTIEAITHPDWRKIDNIIAWAQAPHHTLLTLGDPRYPKLLTEIADPPFLLYIDGALQHLQQPQIAIIGTRKPTQLGLAITRHFTQGLGQAGLTITSGMALGIDGTSHQAAIDAGLPTIAVVGTGIDVTYPRQHEKLAAKIRGNGAIVSEFPLTSSPSAKNFPRRNRIISGLSLGTLVVEATPKSGSLITARLAIEQDREVFAIPGSMINPMAIGCHHLIQRGAKLVTSVADIVTELRFSPQINALPSHAYALKPANTAKLDNDHQKLIECIGFDVMNFEQLVDRTGYTTQKVSAMLCNLMISGYIQEELSGYSRVIL